MSINQLIINFHDFLISCWPSISRIVEELNWDDNPYFIENWIQANWELIVEVQILESGDFLVPYGYERSSECRYTKKGSNLTHRVICKQKNQPEYRYGFLCFVTNNDGVFKLEPPFDFIDVEDLCTGARLSLAFDDVEFFIEKIKQ